jgi:hypothetical protein
MGEVPNKRAQRARPAAPIKPADNSITIVPDQHHDHIERRREIREAFHDSLSRTIKADVDES